MKIIPLSCPQCKASLQIEDTERKFIFCQYCGQKIYLDDETRTIKQIDEARIREADVAERIRLAELELELANRKRKFTLVIIGIILAVLLLAALFYVLFYTESGFFLGMALFFLMFMIFAVLMAKYTKDN